jgi:tRNA(Ile)-lysidine synthase
MEKVAPVCGGGRLLREARPGAVVSHALSAAFSPGPAPERLGVAVSGGGDSLALLLLAQDWAAGRGVALRAVTVDHGLRPQAAGEARVVSETCAARGISHEVLYWRGWSGAGNLQAEARAARYGLMAEWARRGDIPAVALGHTMDDQAETVLLRLARGSGVDGLSGMAPARRALGVDWLRPMLGLRRAALRDYLRERGVDWAEDPSNDDPRYDRVTARAALAALAPLGVGVAGLVETAARLSDARAALEEGARAAAAGMLRVEAGDVLIEAAPFRALPRETRERIFAHAMCWIASAPYRPRHAALRRAIERALDGQGGTLHGCLVSARPGDLRLSREPRAVVGLRAPVGGVWDNRWRLVPPPGHDIVGEGAASGGAAEIAALGEGGLRACPDWRAAGLPRATLIAAPALWRGETLLAAPLAGKANGWTAELIDGGAGLFKMALSD